MTHRLRALLRTRTATRQALILAAGILLAGVAGAFAASPAALVQDRLDGPRYRSLLAETLDGLFIASGRELASFPGASAASVVREFIASRPEPVQLQAAALLHTEAAVLASQDADRHLEYARALLAALPDAARREVWLRRWWLAVGYSYQVALNSVAGVAAYEAALDDLPGDREIREALAAMLQMVGRQREEQPYLLRAEELLRELLGEMPKDAELRVRLAGVLLDLGRVQEAERELDAVEGARLPPLPRLAALLIRGEAALGAEHFRDAETAFAEAARRARRSPAAVSGLVAARLALGDRTGAAEAASTLLSRPAAGWEPEWRYWLGPALDFQELFQAMKDEVRDAAGRQETPR